MNWSELFWKVLWQKTPNYLLISSSHEEEHRRFAITDFFREPQVGNNCSIRLRWAANVTGAEGHTEGAQFIDQLSLHRLATIRLTGEGISCGPLRHIGCHLTPSTTSIRSEPCTGVRHASQCHLSYLCVNLNPRQAILLRPLLCLGDIRVQSYGKNTDWGWNFRFS
jgi:hypothetical protein